MTFSVTANTAAAVGAEEFASAINAVANFTADGNYALDNGDGTVVIQWVRRFYCESYRGITIRGHHSAYV